MHRGKEPHKLGALRQTWSSLPSWVRRQQRHLSNNEQVYSEHAIIWPFSRFSSLISGDKGEGPVSGGASILYFGEIRSLRIKLLLFVLLELPRASGSSMSASSNSRRVERGGCAVT